MVQFLKIVNMMLKVNYDGRAAILLFYSMSINFIIDEEFRLWLSIYNLENNIC
jgi:hypothetical protein